MVSASLSNLAVKVTVASFHLWAPVANVNGWQLARGQSPVPFAMQNAPAASFLSCTVLQTTLMAFMGSLLSTNTC